MSFPQKRNGILREVKPQLRQRYRLQEKAVAAYRAALEAEYQMTPMEFRVISEAVIERVIKNFSNSLSKNAPDVLLSESEVLESMLFDAAIVSEKMDESGELDRLVAAEQTREDREKHDF